MITVYAIAKEKDLKNQLDERKRLLKINGELLKKVVFLEEESKKSFDSILDGVKTIKKFGGFEAQIEMAKIERTVTESQSFVDKEDVEEVNQIEFFNSSNSEPDAYVLTYTATSTLQTQMDKQIKPKMNRNVFDCCGVGEYVDNEVVSIESKIKALEKKKSLAQEEKKSLIETRNKLKEYVVFNINEDIDVFSCRL